MFLSGDVVYSKHLSGIARITLYNKEGPIMPDVILEVPRAMERVLKKYQEAAPSPCKLFLLSELSEKQLHSLLNLKDCRPVGDHSVPGISGPVEDESFPSGELTKPCCLCFPRTFMTSAATLPHGK